MLMDIPSIWSWVDEISKCAAGRSIFAHAYIQLERCFPFFSSQALSKSNVILKLHSIDWHKIPLYCGSCTRSGLFVTCELWFLVCNGLDTQIFTDCILGCTFVTDIVNVCVRDHRVLVTTTSGSRLPIGLGNDNDNFSQPVRPTGQINSQATWSGQGPS